MSLFQIVSNDASTSSSSKSAKVEFVLAEEGGHEEGGGTIMLSVAKFRLLPCRTMGDYGWSRDSVASQGNEVVVDGWVLYTQR